MPTSPERGQEAEEGGQVDRCLKAATPTAQGGKRKIATGMELGDAEVGILWCPSFTEGWVLRAQSPLRGRSRTIPMDARPGWGGTQLPPVPIPVRATNPSQRQPPAGPVLAPSDLPGHAQHLPSAVRAGLPMAQHGTARHNVAPACLLCRLHASRQGTAGIRAQAAPSWGGGTVPAETPPDPASGSPGPCRKGPEPAASAEGGENRARAKEGKTNQGVLGELKT